MAGAYEIFASEDFKSWPSPDGCIKDRENVLNGVPSAKFLTEPFNEVMISDRQECTAEEAFSGSWKGGTIDVISWTITGHAVWQPFGCHLHPPVLKVNQREPASQYELLSDIGEVQIVLMGDSTLEAVFKNTLNLVKGNASHNAVRTAESNPDFFTASEKMCPSNDGKHRYFDLLLRSPSSWSFVWSGAKNPCEGCETLIPWKNTPPVGRVRFLAKRALQSCQKLIVVLNSGLHDLFDPDCTFDKYRMYVLDKILAIQDVFLENAKNKSETVARCGRPLTPTLAWASTQPKSDKRQCQKGGNDTGAWSSFKLNEGQYVAPYSNTPIFILNKIAAQAAHDTGLPFLDLHQIRAATLTEGDGHHCEANYYDWENIRNMTTSCEWMSRAMLHAIWRLSSDIL